MYSEEEWAGEEDSSSSFSSSSYFPSRLYGLGLWEEGEGEGAVAVIMAGGWVDVVLFFSWKNYNK